MYMCMCMYMYSIRMKLLTRCRVVLQQLTRLKLRTVLVGKAVHCGDVIRRAYLVQVAERAATKGGKAGSKDEANVSDDGIVNDAVLQAFNSLVHESDQIIL
jgi:hypothetical protein